MTIDEAIKQFKEDAEYNRADLDLEWAEENEQVAKWLNELKAIKENAVFYSNKPIEDIVREARADAIEEFVKAIEKHQTRQDSYLEPPYVEMGLDMTDVLEVAKQLKERNNWNKSD